MHLEGDFLELLKPGLDMVFDLAADDGDEFWKDIFKQRSSKRSYEEMYSVSPMDVASPKAEATEMAYGKIAMKYKTRFTHVTYGLQAGVSQELLDDDQYGKIGQIPEFIAKSIYNCMATRFGNFFNTAFTDSSAYLQADGEPLMGDGSTKLHPTTVGTWRNQLATAADLSFTCLADLIILLLRNVDDRGNPWPLTPDLLICGPEDTLIADELLQSTDRPDTGNRAINVIKRNYNIKKRVVSHLTTGKKRVFLRAKDSQHYMFWYPRKGVTKKSDYKPGKDVVLYMASRRDSWGASDSRGIVGSPGTV